MDQLSYLNERMFREDIVPNLGSVITLDNKGRLINSQFSKPSSSQSLLKLNSVEEIPDADDLPFSIISYGDTPNSTNLPYNDHNYIGNFNNRGFDNYDKKAKDYIQKQNSQSSSKSSYSSSSSLRITPFNSYSNYLSANDSSMSSNSNKCDSIFPNDKSKINNQLLFNQSISSTSTPVIGSRTVNNISQSNGILNRKQILPHGAIVINQSSLNKVKSMGVIKVQRSSYDSSPISESRIINFPIKKPPDLLDSDSYSNSLTSNLDKSDLSKSINLIPRCICGFTHDDGGMIRCEICQTWQHIICMYPDHKFPIFYKCEKCEPRGVDYTRAIDTQTNYLINSGHNPTDFLPSKDYHDVDFDRNYESTLSNSNVPQYVIVPSDLQNVYVSNHDVLQNGPGSSLYISASKDSHIVPPGSPRTSKRKQDLISLKTVLGKPSVVTPNNTFNNVLIQTRNETSLPILVEAPATYNISNYLLPTSASQIHHPNNNSTDMLPSSFNELSPKLKTLLMNNGQPDSNLTIQQMHFLKQTNFKLNNGGSDMNYVNYNTIVKAVADYNSTEVIFEYNGYVSLADEYNKEFDYKKIYNPHILFYDKFDHLQLCIDSKNVSNKAKYIRRSCTPNAEAKHRYLTNGQIYFYIVPINKISKDSEITIGFDFNYSKCRYPVECACNQLLCELKIEEARNKRASALSPLDTFCGGLDSAKYGGIDSSTNAIRRPYKKRGRASKASIISGRTMVEKQPPIDPILKPIRRNKRGRPPLSRTNGIQRSDVAVSKALSDSSSNREPCDFKHESDDESQLYNQNETLNSILPLYSNFKNFKRISSSHWSIKAHKKLMNINKKVNPVKLAVPKKVGRPLKNKTKLDEEKVDCYSDKSPNDVHKFGDCCFDTDQNALSNEDYEQSNSVTSDSKKQHDEGKYWLEEVNRKIQKQKLKENKRSTQVSTKCRNDNKVMKKQLHQQANFLMSAPSIEPMETNQTTDDESTSSETYSSKVDDLKDNVDVKLSMPYEKVKERRMAINTNLKRVSKRGRKTVKHSSDYILSYKESNIDDLKNDLMLISASLEEDLEDGDNGLKENEIIDNMKTEEIVEMEREQTDNHNQSFNEFVFDESKEFESDHNNSKWHYQQSSDEKCVVTTTTTAITTNVHSSKQSRIKKENIAKSSTDISMDSNNKVTREERWVSIMWQRILKSEKSSEGGKSSSKRKRNKSSTNDDLSYSTDALSESMENSFTNDKLEGAGSINCMGDYYDEKPKVIENKEEEIVQQQQVSSIPPVSTVKLSNQKFKRRESKESKLSCSETLHDQRQQIDVDRRGVTIGSSKLHNHQQFKSSRSSKLKSKESAKGISTNDQCELIVYKEQDSNPMEKFSRENSAKIFSSDGNNSTEGSTPDKSVNQQSHQPHGKKRWLSQALLEENLKDDCSVKDPQLVINSVSASCIVKDSEVIPTVAPSIFDDKLSSVESTSKHSFLPPVITSIDNCDSLPNSQKTAINPKKRLLNQFSMEDSAFSLTKQELYSKQSKWSTSTSMEPEQSKTKLTLSEYRKRRFIENPNKDQHIRPAVISKLPSVDPNKEWAGLTEMSIKLEEVELDVPRSSHQDFQKLPLEESSYSETLKHLNIITNSSCLENSREEQTVSETSDEKSNLLMSYLDTLNNLSIPSKLDPTIPFSCSIFGGSSMKNSIIDNSDYHHNEQPDLIDIDRQSSIVSGNLSPLSPDATVTKYFDRGPRTPSDIQDLSWNAVDNTIGSKESVHSFESQPSPSDSYFDMDRMEKENMEGITNDKFSPTDTDWTNDLTVVAKLAGIQNPLLLHEIEEFDDEYVPLPEKMPERTKEEMETLMLTQRRDSQIREWQEVKQLEREKNKLEHQVRSLQRRLQRAAGTTAGNGRVTVGCSQGQLQPMDTGQKPIAGSSNTLTDEQTMKVFNTQLSNFNDKLLEQINSLKKTRSQVAEPQNDNLPVSVQQQHPDLNNISTAAISSRLSNGLSSGDLPHERIRFTIRSTAVLTGRIDDQSPVLNVGGSPRLSTGCKQQSSSLSSSDESQPSNNPSLLTTQSNVNNCCMSDCLPASAAASVYKSLKQQQPELTSSAFM